MMICQHNFPGGSMCEHCGVDEHDYFVAKLAALENGLREILALCESDAPDYDVAPKVHDIARRVLRSTSAPAPRDE